MSNQDQDLTVANGKTAVYVSYLPFPSSAPPMPCVITIYTATGPRHPVEATVEQRTASGWEWKSDSLVNNYPIGTLGTSFGEHLRFTFDCPAPGQYWEIHIETPSFSPFPNYLDSMIGSCEVREFAIAYPGIITRLNPRATTEAEVFAGYVSKPAATEGAGTTA